jgi:hypothetical protein
MESGIRFGGLQGINKESKGRPVIFDREGKILADVTHKRLWSAEKVLSSFPPTFHVLSASILSTFYCLLSTLFPAQRVRWTGGGGEITPQVSTRVRSPEVHLRTRYVSAHELVEAVEISRRH